MLTVAYVRVGDIKNCQNNAYIICGCPLRGLGRSWLLPILGPARVNHGSKYLSINLKRNPLKLVQVNIQKEIHSDFCW